MAKKASFKLIFGLVSKQEVGYAMYVICGEIMTEERRKQGCTMLLLFVLQKWLDTLDVTLTFLSIRQKNSKEAKANPFPSRKYLRIEKRTPHPGFIA